MTEILRDLRLGFRSLLRSPGFTLAAAMTLALGIGTNAAIFSIVDSVLFRPYPYEDPERLVMLRTQDLLRGGEDERISYPDLDEIRRRSESLSDAAGVLFTTVNLAGGERPLRVRAARTTGNVFNIVGAEPVTGRTFGDEDTGPGRAPVVVLSDTLWQRGFNADPDLVGRPVEVDGVAHTVIGIVPAARQWPDTNDTEVFLPIDLDPATADREARGMIGLGRLAPGVEIERARAELEGLSARLRQEHPAIEGEWRLYALSLREFRTREDRTLLLFALGAVILVLLLACANVANLLLQRYLSRQREYSLRSALGASRSRLISTLLGEAIPLALLGTLLGTALAQALIRGVVRLLPPDDLPTYLRNFSIDGRVALYLLLVSVVTVLAFSLVPALRLLSKRRAVGGVLGQRASASQRLTSLRWLLVSGQISLSLMLLVSAGLMMQSFRQLLATDPGFDPSGLVALELELPDSRYPEADDRRAFWDRLLSRLASVPGVERVGAGQRLPFGGWRGYTPRLESQSPEEASGNPTVGVQLITGDYFETVGVDPVQGRLFERSEESGALGSVVINQNLARRMWPDRSPLGERLLFELEETISLTVIGVVGDVKRRGLGEPTSFDAYLPWRVAGGTDLVPVARVAGDPAAIVGTFRSQVEAIDPTLPVNIRTLRQVLDESVSVQRVGSLLFALFGVLALLLAAFGLYGVIAYSVTQRTREIGIRMAMGSDNRAILRLVLGQTLKMTLVGIVVGLAGALVVSQSISSLLYGVSSTNPSTLLGTTILLIGVGLLASLLPALRASRTDPAVVLRHD